MTQVIPSPEFLSRLIYEYVYIYVYDKYIIYMYHIYSLYDMYESQTIFYSQNLTQYVIQLPG